MRPGASRDTHRFGASLADALVYALVAVDGLAFSQIKTFFLILWHLGTILRTLVCIWY